MIVIETCPKCGHDLQDVVICTYPPIPRKVCWNCGWSWTGEPEKITRVPFGGNSRIDDTPVDEDSIQLNWDRTSTDWDTVNLGTPTLTTTNTTTETINLKDYNCASAFEQTACINCPSNPKNGGNGICYCTLGQRVFY